MFLTIRQDYTWALSSAGNQGTKNTLRYVICIHVCVMYDQFITMPTWYTVLQWQLTVWIIHKQGLSWNKLDYLNSFSIWRLNITSNNIVSTVENFHSVNNLLPQLIYISIMWLFSPTSYLHYTYYCSLHVSQCQLNKSIFE
jgi:hypothetical protein